MTILAVALHTLSSVADFLFSVDPIERRMRDKASAFEMVKVMGR